MKHPERVEDYLRHIAEAIERATSYLQPLADLQAFERTDRFRMRLYATSRSSARQ
jgi:uncharacterized protein with HEPN domain